MTNRTIAANRWGILLLMLLQCACDAQPARSVEQPTGPAPSLAWAGPLQQLFNDGMHPKAMAPVEETAEAARDPQIRFRAAGAELVARVRVRTVTERRVGERTSYRITLQIGSPLRPASWQPAQLELKVTPAQPAFAILRAHRDKVRGRTFVAFFRRFRSSKGGSELHWYLTADTAEVAGAVVGLAVYKEMVQ